MLDDIKETFDRLRRIQMKLNPKKCSFGVESGKFLGVMVDTEGIGVNPAKVEAVLKMEVPKSVKVIMVINGQMVAMQRFLSKAAERSLPFMKVLKDSLKKKTFEWTAEAQKAFEELKVYLCKLPKLVASKVGEQLYMYLAVSSAAVSAVLLVERSGTQIPIYYISRVLKDYEERYTTLEKLAFSLVYASRRLRRYFQAHTVIVLTTFSIQQVLRKPEMSGRLVKWAIELGLFDIEFKPRTAYKGQVLADFLVEGPIDGVPVTWDDAGSELQIWNLHTDGSASKDGSGAGLILVSRDGDELTYALRLSFQASNNEAGYEAFLAGLRLAQKLGVRRLHAHVDR